MTQEAKNNPRLENFQKEVVVKLLSNAEKLSKGTENCPLDLATWMSLVTLVRAVSEPDMDGRPLE